MSIKKKKPVRRPAPRRTTYDIAREHAATRLGKAIDERTECLKKLDQLAYEIPYLENIVSALSGPETAPAAPAVLPQNRSPQPEPYSAPTAAPVPQTPVIMDQEEYLQRFMPRTGRVTTTAPVPSARPQPDGSSPDPDEFLTDGPGTEILS